MKIFLKNISIFSTSLLHTLFSEWVLFHIVDIPANFILSASESKSRTQKYYLCMFIVLCYAGYEILSRALKKCSLISTFATTFARFYYMQT